MFVDHGCNDEVRYQSVSSGGVCGFADSLDNIAAKINKYLTLVFDKCAKQWPV